jgi:membrane protease YdiL (CAAX protease family)
MAFVVFMIDNNLEHNKIASCVLSGDHPMMGVAFLGAGALFGALLVSQHQSIGVTLLQLTGTQKFLFTVGVAAVVEEMFFRWTMFPTIRQLLMGKVPYASVVALFVVNISFGLFHFYVYNASLAGVWLACILGIIYTIGNYACKSGNFSLGAHAMNNFLMMSVSI